MTTLCTCFSIRAGRDEGWETASGKGKEFGLDLRELKKAYRELPELSTKDVEIADKVLRVTAEAVSRIRMNCMLKKRIERPAGEL